MLYGINQLWGDVPVVCVIHMYIAGAYLAISRLIMLNVLYIYIYIYIIYILFLVKCDFQVILGVMYAFFKIS